MWRFNQVIKKYKLPIIICLAIWIVAIAAFMQDGTEETLKGYTIEREGYEGKDRVYSIDARVGDLTFENIEVNVEKRRYSTSELHELFLACHDLIKDFLSIDSGSGYVSEDLSFESALPQSPLSWEWVSLDESIITSEGVIKTPKESYAQVVCIASYGEWSESCSFEFLIKPNEDIKRRYVKESVEELIRQRQEDTSENESFELPGQIDDVEIHYTEKESKDAFKYLLIAVIACIVVFVAFFYDSKNEVKNKKSEILYEYPVVIQKLVMYISAGMTVRNAWSRICEGRYRNATDKSSKGSLGIYEEMIITENEIKTGVSESIAYEHFGERINDNTIIRFTTLLSQNIRKGSTSLSQLLSEESQRAFELRMNNARKKGEEAGTKLLLPMALLLIVVTVMIMIPAFWNL